MFHTKFKYEKREERAITLKLGSGDLYTPEVSCSKL